MNIFITIEMNLLLNINDVNLSQIFFLDKKTNIIMDGVFTKIIYSSNCISMNGVYIDLPIKNIMTNKIHSKNIIQLDTINNKDLFQKIVDIERQLLSYYVQYFLPLQSDMTFLSENSQNNRSKSLVRLHDTSHDISYVLNEKYANEQKKTIVYTLKNQIENKCIKYYKDYTSYSKPVSFYIKISGIWENQYEIGITFKLIEYKKQI